MRYLLWLASLLALAAYTSNVHAVSTESVQTVSIHPGHASASLNGPWRFKTGDDLRWASPDLDDSQWESVDLTPAPGAHDADVGLPGYVSGWSMRGHPGYIGYAWYRMRVTIDGGADARLALTGPTDVDSTYQLYVDGNLLGGPGVFSGKNPTVYSVQPTVFSLPALSSTNAHTYLIALRVWMDPLDAGDDSGGIHIAPTIGTADDIALLHQVQWLQTFKGYVVDAVEPLAFVLLAIMAAALMMCRSQNAYHWLVAALLLTAWLRANQVFYFWTHAESLRVYDVATAVLLVPLALSTWVLAWRDWFGVTMHAWLRRALAVLTIAYVLFSLIGRPWFAPDATGGLKSAANTLVEAVRVIDAAIYLWIIGLGLMREPRLSACWSVLAAILLGTGLFAAELSKLGVQGIWFPYGTGVSRTQFAYAGFILLLFALILMRFVRHAKTKWRR
jgi:hypothetical protein